MITSAPYFSLAYFCASAACPWWNTFDRSDTKNAIFFGLSVAGLYSVAAAAGALVGSAGATVGASGALVGSAGACVGAAGAAAGAAVGAAGAAPPQADRTRLVSTSTANSVNR